MKFYEYLNEGLLYADFSIGFELEGFSTIDNNHEDIFKRIISLNPIWKNGNMMEDSSLKPDEENDTSFEYGSPVLKFTISTFKELLNFFESLSELGIYTNSSCGLHFHMSFPNIETNDIFWLLINLSNDKEMKKKLLIFNKYGFFNKDYASSKFLSDINKFLILFKNKEILLQSTDGINELIKWNKIFSTEKYRVLRVHPQGTLEWRGPRNFLASKNKKEIRQFLFLLRDFISYFINVLNKKEIDGLLRQDFNIFLQKLDTKKFKPNLENFIKDYTVEKMVFYISKNNDFIWESGTWYEGIWKDGVWKDGLWISGIWIKGIWIKGEIFSNYYNKNISSLINPEKFKNLEKKRMAYDDFIEALKKEERDEIKKYIKKEKEF